jgi:hypothetical protein
MGGAYPYMDLNANYEKHYYDVLLRLIQIRIYLPSVCFCSQRGLQIGPIQRMGAAPGVIHTGRFFVLIREIATCKQNVGQKEDFMHSNFEMDISLP